MSFSNKTLRRSAALLIIAILAGALFILAGCGQPVASTDSTADTTSNRSHADHPVPSPGSTELPGLQETEAAWLPELDNMPARVQALGFPPVGDEAYHLHALLNLYVNGKKMPVPANIGVSQAAQFMSALHTHDGTGVIHIEAATEYPFTIGDIFAVYGVVFTEDQLGSHKNAGGTTVQVYVDGKKVDDPVHAKIKDGQNIVVAYGTEGSFPKEPPADALEQH